MTIYQCALVCRSGGIYQPEHANILVRNLRRFNNHIARYLVLTDMDPSLFTEGDMCIVPLPDNALPGWWSKMYLFSDAYTPASEPFLYCDLDTIAVRNFDWLLQTTYRPTVLRDFMNPYGMIGSGFMVIDRCMKHHIFDNFMRSKNAHMSRYRKGGDQAFLYEHLWNADRWQDRTHISNKYISSYKVDCVPMMESGAGNFPEDAAIICFHGDPKPWNAALWVKEYWR